MKIFTPNGLRVATDQRGAKVPHSLLSPTQAQQAVQACLLALPPESQAANRFWELLSWRPEQIESPP